MMQISKKSFAGIIVLILLLLGVTFWSFIQLKKKVCKVSRTEQKNAILQDSIRHLKDSIIVLQDSLYDQMIFGLEENAPALDYLDKFYGERSNWPAYIRDKLMETNAGKNTNPLIPYEGISGPLKINNVRILNHKWIIANFTDGKIWGEIFMEYEPQKNDSISFHVIKSFLYPMQN